MKTMFTNLKNRMNKAVVSAKTLATDTRGDLATNTIGAIIVGVVIVGLLITAVNSFFPTFFTDMFGDMSAKLNLNW